MKKLITTPKYKEKSRRLMLKLRRHGRKRHSEVYSATYYDRVTKFKGGEFLNYVIPAPIDFRLFDNAEECLLFFRRLRDKKNYNSSKYGFNASYVSITLKNVKHIDYATISVLNAIGDDLKDRKVQLRGDFPNDSNCNRFLVESGFLDHVKNRFGKRYGKSSGSEMIFFEKGCGKLSINDNVRIAEAVKDAVNHLIGKRQHFNPVKTILLEVCGNSIEHAYIANSKHWLLGTKYEKDKVIFTVTDVGKGILETINKKFIREIRDLISHKKRHEVLLGAFDRKYGSSTEEINRNKGLPSIKEAFRQGKIRNLRVLTNDAVLVFDDNLKTKTFASGSPRFKGTIYQWDITKDCIID